MHIIKLLQSIHVMIAQIIIFYQIGRCSYHFIPRRMMYKSLATTHCPSPTSSPHGFALGDSAQPSPNGQKPKLSAIQSFMNSTLNSLNNLSSERFKDRKSNRPKISILPLTREKIKVSVRKRVPGQSRTSHFKTYRTTRASIHNSPKIAEAEKDAQNTNAEQKNKYQEFFTILATVGMKKRRKNRKMEVLVDELATHFSKTKAQQYQKQIEQILTLAPHIMSSLTNPASPLSYQLIKLCYYDLSKLFFNISFELYLYKSNKLNLQTLQTIHKDIEYSARRLGMLRLTIQCCMDMGRWFCEGYEFDKAKKEYNKTVKLAVFTNDKYAEEMAIDRLGMCAYYRGDAVEAHFYHSSFSKLSPYQHWKIKDSYSNEGEIKKLLQAKTKEKQKKSHIFLDNDDKQNENGQSIQEELEEQFHFEHVKDDNYSTKNCTTFRSNLKQMIKISLLRKKMPIIKSALSKADLIGVKKYCGHDYLVPKASKFTSHTSTSQDEVLLSHRSFNRNNVAFEGTRIDRDVRLLEQCFGFLKNGQKKYKTQFCNESQ